MTNKTAQPSKARKAFSFLGDVLTVIASMGPSMKSQRILADIKAGKQLDYYDMQYTEQAFACYLAQLESTED